MRHRPHNRRPVALPPDPRLNARIQTQWEEQNRLALFRTVGDPWQPEERRWRARRASLARPESVQLVNFARKSNGLQD
jgi:hypothetical protein